MKPELQGGHETRVRFIRSKKCKPLCGLKRVSSKQYCTLTNHESLLKLHLASCPSDRNISLQHHGLFHLKPAGSFLSQSIVGGWFPNPSEKNRQPSNWIISPEKSRQNFQKMFEL